MARPERNPPDMRPRRTARDRLLHAGAAVFAERGYKDASVRLICRRARIHPAAVQLYYGNKEDFYHEILREAMEALSESDVDADDFIALPPEAMLYEYFRSQLMPILRRKQISRFLRIMALEEVAPTKAFKKYFATRHVLLLYRTNVLARRLLPGERESENLSIVESWLMNQTGPFIRHLATLADTPFNIKFDAAMIDRLARLLTRFVLLGVNSVSFDTTTSASVVPEIEMGDRNEPTRNR